VVTFDIPAATTEGSSSEPKVTFWEALGGQQYELPHPSDDRTPPRPASSSSSSHNRSQRHSFCELHCLFRHNCFMLNVQPVCTVPNTLPRQPALRPDVAPPPVMSFAVSDQKNFALFPSHALCPLLRHPGCGLQLSYDDRFSQSGQVAALEASLEKELREEVAQWRYEKSLYTNFDENLSIILQVFSLFDASTLYNTTSFSVVSVHWFTTTN
jgi:hypothetical protein